jgi:hypothetical protein
MNWLLMLIVGAALLIIDYFATLPPPVHTILKILGWILVVVALILFVFGLLGAPVLR